ncbi:MAG: phosphoribosylanthranilate isomerase [Geminicoccaceae bacterium]
MSRTRIKICCISSPEEARLAVEHGADAIGLVGPMPSGPGVIDDRLIAEIAQAVPPPVATFLLTSETSPDAIIAHARACGTNTVQLVDHVAPSDYPVLRAGLPGIRLVQVIHVEGPSSIDDAKTMGHLADALLLDSGRVSLQVKELGGTGRTHDWSLSREIVRVSPCPVFLAGGLKPENVGQAIREVRPYGLDLCTGVRTENRLDAEKLRRFVESVANADAV